MGLCQDSSTTHLLHYYYYHYYSTQKTKRTRVYTIPPSTSSSSSSSSPSPSSSYSRRVRRRWTLHDITSYNNVIILFYRETQINSIERLFRYFLLYARYVKLNNSQLAHIVQHSVSGRTDITVIFCQTVRRDLCRLIIITRVLLTQGLYLNSVVITL